MRKLITCCLLWLFVCTVHALFVAQPVYADSIIPVTTDTDSIANDGLCSLREAVIAANRDSAFHDCPSGSGADTILLDPTLPRPIVITLTLVGAGEDSALSGDLDITGTLTISSELTDGANAMFVIDGDGADRLFDLHQGANLTIVGITLRNGNLAENGGAARINQGAHLKVNNSQFLNNHGLKGGGIAVAGRLTMNDSSVVDNQGGGIYNAGGLLKLQNVQILNNLGGYGIEQNGGALTFTNGQVAANEAGGLYNGSAARATLSHITLNRNSGNGGAINTGATLTRLTIIDSLIMSNTATTGAGVFNEGTGANLDIYSTFISGNQASSSGGALYNSGLLTIHDSTIAFNRARAGAGLHHFGGNLSLVNVTMSQNRADDNGGALYSHASAVLNSVTLVQNQAGGAGGNLFLDESALSIVNSIVTNAQVGNNCGRSGGVLTSLGHNLENANSCGFNAAGDLPNTAPRLGPLAANGGSTPTHALLPNSAAIDRGAPDCPNVDQRGIARPQGVACDIGAFEYAPTADLAIAATVAPPTVTTGSRLTYTLTITNWGPITATALTLTDDVPTGSSIMTATIAGGACTLTMPIRCRVNELNPGRQLRATIVLTAPPISAPITNTAEITSSTRDLLPANNRVVSGSIVTAPPDLAPPEQVTNLTATALTTQGATLHWDTAVDNVGVVGYRIFAKRSSQAQAPFLIAVVDSHTTTYTVTTLLSHTSYQLWVIAFDAAGNIAGFDAATPVVVETLTLTLGVIQISTEPPLPTDHEPVSITISGLYTSSCVPHYGSHQVVGQQITIRSALSSEPFCLLAEFPWSYTVGISALAAGRYTVTHQLDSVQTTAGFSVTAVTGPVLPIFHVAGNQPYSAVIDQPFHLQLQASGIPAPIYTLAQAPDGMTIDLTSGQIAWLPQTSLAPTYTVIVRARNELGSAEYQFTIHMQTPRTGAFPLFLPMVTKS